MSDNQANQILFFDKKGNCIRRVGQKGQGPNEYKRPGSIVQTDTNLIINDHGNSRFQYLSLTGDYIAIKSYEIEVAPLISSRGESFDHSGNYFLATNGYLADSLIQKFDKSFNPKKLFGELESDQFDYLNYASLKKAIENNQIPAVLVNSILLEYCEDATLLAVHMSIPVIKRFSSQGKLLFRKSLKVPEMDLMKEKFFSDNKKSKKKRFRPLYYWMDLALDNKGGAYLLLFYNEKMILYHVDYDGNLIEKLIGPSDFISQIVLNGNELWAFGISSLKFYRFEI